jgi:hypothetical protein
MAFDVDLAFIAELWDQIQERFISFGRKPTENNRRQAYIPVGAIPIVNPVGTAPAFIMETGNSCVISLPGVPAEMVFLLEDTVVPYLRKRLNLRGIIKSRILRTAGLGESVIDKRIEDLEQLSNPTVGLSAHPGRVDIRITAKAGSELEADEMIWGVEATLHQRLGESIYGTDEATLESVIASWLREQGLKICTLEYGTAGALGASFAPFSDVFAGGQLINTPEEVEQVERTLVELCIAADAECGIALLLEEDEKGQKLMSHLILGSEKQSQERLYTGKFVYAEARAVSLGLERLRRMMLNHPPKGAINNS